MEKDALSEKERAAFDRLRRQQQPPAGLEHTVLTALQEEGLLRTASRPNRKWLPLAAAIAGIALFLGGYLLGGTQNKAEGQIRPELGYMLLLHEDARFRPGEPMEMFEEYKAWMESVGSQGVAITGQELQNDALILDADRSPETDAAERTTGYFLLEAASLEQAAAIARSIPHLKYGGSVEVKAFMNR